MTSRRKAKKSSRADADISPSLLRKLKKVANTPRNQWIMGTHADVLAMGKLSRETKTTSRRKTRG
jgi:hypothetical protein